MTEPPRTNSTSRVPEQPYRAPKPSGDTLKQFRESKLLVLGVIFFATAVLGIPLLWVNRKFSNLERLFWTIVVLLYTALLFWLTYLVLSWSWGQIQQSIALLGWI